MNGTEIDLHIGNELSPRDSRDVAFIQLKGEPYQRMLPNGEVIDCNITADNLVEANRYRETLPDRINQVEENLSPLLEQEGFYTLDGKLKHGQDLSFSEAFSLATFVCSALNRPLNTELAPRIIALGSHDTHLLQATSLLSAMSAKEAYAGLIPDEIAGLVAATVHLDTFVRVQNGDPTIAFGGMGGDKGYPLNGKNTKLFSLSTLASIALAADGPVHKHHSYPNTSKVAGQSAIEVFGARSDFHTPDAFQHVLSDTNLIMTSCHDTRTLHSLSHKLKGETINHVIGPLAYTLSAETAIQAMIGVNEKIHPERITQALEILNARGFQRYDSAAVFCGTDLAEIHPEDIQDAPQNIKYLAEHVRLDEIAPPPYTSLVAFLQNGINSGTFIVRPEDFYPEEVLQQMSPDDLEIPNTFEDIINANREALSGKHFTRTRYLAMTTGMGLFVKYALSQEGALNQNTRTINREYLRACTAKALSILTSGSAEQKLREYVEVTKRESGVRLNSYD